MKISYAITLMLVSNYRDAQHDSEIISEQIKTKMDPVPDVNLKFHQIEDGKTLILLFVKKGDESPYFYNADGSRIAFVRIGNESVQADALTFKRLVRFVILAYSILTGMEKVRLVA